MIRVDGATIAAVATAPGHGGIGIVRVSGPRSATIAEAMTGRCPVARRASFVAFRAADGSALDHGIALFFRGPASYTGEDTLELQGHGGPAVLDRVLRRVMELGARPARPGEFTERAFLNGRLDLAQAEAVADLIAADSEAAARGAMRSLCGEFSRQVEDVRGELIELRAWVESSLDFPDDDIEVMPSDAVERRLIDLSDRLRRLLDATRAGARLAEGATVVIAGPPNAGKSTLLNALAGEDRAIVTPVPGTTRDVLRVAFHLDGVPVELVDTAGLRDTDDEIEREGVARARREVQRADLVLWLTAPDAPGVIEDDGGPVIEVLSKSDLLPTPHRFGRQDGSSGVPRVAISARTGGGLDALIETLRDALGTPGRTTHAFTARTRHVDALRRTGDALERGLSTWRSQLAAEILAEDLRAADDHLGEITGRTAPDALLGEIFARFCIGK